MMFVFFLQEQEQLSYSSTRTKNPSVVVTGLRPSTVYVFHVRVRTAAGYTAYSPNYEFATAAEGNEHEGRRLCLCSHWLCSRKEKALIFCVEIKKLVLFPTHGLEGKGSLRPKM